MLLFKVLHILRQNDLSLLPYPRTSSRTFALPTIVPAKEQAELSGGHAAEATP